MSTLKLRPRDVGFDPLVTGHTVKIPADASCAEILTDGKEYLIQGSAEFICKELITRGYKAEVELPTITITRTGEPPLRFTGFKIGSENIATGAGRGIRVQIYKTKSGKYVASVEHHTCWQGEHSTTNAKSIATPLEVVEWLRPDKGGRLGRASQEACEEAAKNDEAFGKAFVEEVE